MTSIIKNFFQKSKVALSADIVNMVKHSLNSQWTYTNFVNGDEEAFFQENPLEEFPEITKRFNEIKRGEHKADLFRYYYLYVKGGVYMDSDAMIYQPIDSIVGDKQFFAVDSWLPDTISNCIIASGKGNPIIYAALKQMYTMDLSVLDTDFQFLCKSLHSIYNSYNGDKTGFALFKEVANESGDRIVDANVNDRVLFKHFWRNKENIPNHLLSLAKPPNIRSKNLVYMCVFYNKDYFKLLDLLLMSMKFFSTTDTFDLLVLTSPDMEQCVHELCTKINLNIHIMPCDFTTIFQAACARLHIFDYEHINSYERLLYLDTDIIIKADLAPLFSIELRDVLYALEQGTVSMPNFGSQFFDSNILGSGKTGLNSGTLLFKNCLTVRYLFSLTKLHIQNFTDSGAAIPYTMDQPFINYQAIKSDLYDNKMLNPYISLYEGNDEVANYETSIICHFSYPIGNFGHKHYRMKEFFIGLLEAPSSEKGLENAALVGKTYNWGTHGGYITFKESRLETKWGNGSYHILDKGMVRVIWNNYYHTLKFSDDYSTYSSLRTGPRDLDWMSGNLDTSLINKLQNKLTLKYGSFRDEYPEQVMSTKFLTGNEKVLEIGGNIGRNTLIIASILNDSRNLVSLECCVENAKHLTENRDLNKLNFHVECSAISKRPLIQTAWDTIVSDVVLEGYTKVNTLTFDELVKKYNIEFDTLIADCEGALYYILMDMPEMLDKITLIMMENDYHDLVHKEFVDFVLEEAGFKRIYKEAGGWGPCYDFFYEAWRKSA